MVQLNGYSPAVPINSTIHMKDGPGYAVRGSGPGLIRRTVVDHCCFGDLAEASMR